MALLVFNPDGSPKNELAASECEKWHVSTLAELTARKARIRKILAGKASPANRHLDQRNCGTGAGGFKLDNTCAKGGDGESPSDSRPESGGEERPEGGYTQKISGAIESVMSAHGLDPEKSYTRARGLIDLPAPEVVQGIAAEQQEQNGKPLSDEARASYDAFKSELLDQYNALVEAGLRPIPFEGKGEPYNAGPDKLWTPSSEVMRREVERTGDFFFFKTDVGFGEEGSKPTEGHPLLEVSPAKDANGKPLLWNDVFRVVHDNVAHIHGGFGFNTKGEMNGMIAHASTLSPEARPALFAETFAQNAVYETTKKFAAQNAFVPSAASMSVLDDLLAKSATLTGTNQRAMPDEDRDDDEDTPTGPGRLRRQPRGDDASGGTESEADDDEGESRNCGTGKGGFQPGNNCAKGRYPGEPASVGTPIDARGATAKRVSELLLAGHNVTVRANDVDKIFRKMAAREENPDITNLVIHGTTLFGGEGLGISRGEMPQLGDNIDGFREQLRAVGISSEDVQISPMPIKPVQKEISGRKAGMKYLKIAKKGRDAIKPVIVSRDGFVIDGHHGWAASVARATKSAGYKMNAIVLDADHQTALRHAREWMASQGVQPKTLDTRELRNCGTGAGGFQPGNTCAAGGDGEGSVATEEQPPQNGNDFLNRNKPTDTVYDPKSLIEKGPPSEYEGGYLKEGQTLWDRFSMPSSSGAAGPLDEIQVAQDLVGMYERPYEDDSQAKRKEIESEMPLRKQHQELMDAGAAALGWNDPANSGLDEVPHSDVWVAKQFSSSVTNELMAELSRLSPTAEQKAKASHLLEVQERVNSDGKTRVTASDVERLSQLARETKLPDGVTLFHGMAGLDGRDLLDSMARTRGEFSLNKLTSTTIRPSVAAQFADGTDFTGRVPPENKVSGGEMIHAGGTLGSVVRILGAPRGLPIAAASLYQNETEVVLAPGTKLRFTGDARVVFIPAGNDSGWPAKTFEPKGSVWGRDHARALYPMKVYDAEVVE